MTLEELQEFEKGYAGTIPEGKLMQYSIANMKNMDHVVDYAKHDTSHDVSFVAGHGSAVRLGTFQHGHYAGYIETILNAYRNGDLVHKDSLLEVKE